MIRALVLGAAVGAVLFLPLATARADVIDDAVTTLGDSADATLDAVDDAAAGLGETVDGTVQDPVNDVGGTIDGTVDGTVDPIVDVVDDPVTGGGGTAPEPPRPDTSPDAGGGSDGRGSSGADGPAPPDPQWRAEPFGGSIPTMRPAGGDDRLTPSSPPLLQDPATVNDVLTTGPDEERGGPSFVATSGGFALGIVAAVIAVFLLFHAAALWLRISEEGPAGRQASTLRL